MQMNTKRQARPGRQATAFTLVETIVSLGVASICFVSLYAGISLGIQTIQVSRADLRATQIMVEKMETIRLHAWEQVISGTNIPTTFTENFYPPGICSKGITYYGTVAISPVSWNVNYAGDMRSVIVRVAWTNFSAPKAREMRTTVARHGMQNYVF